MKFPGWLFVEYNRRSVNCCAWWSVRYECAARGEAPGATNPTTVWKLAPVLHKQESICGQMNEWRCREEDGCEAILFYILNGLWKLPKTRVDWIYPASFFAPAAWYHQQSRKSTPAKYAASGHRDAIQASSQASFSKRNSISDPQRMGVKD